MQLAKFLILTFRTKHFKLLEDMYYKYCTRNLHAEDQKGGDRSWKDLHKEGKAGVLIHDLVWKAGGHFVIITSLQGKQSTATVFHGILAKPFKIRHLLISPLCSNLWNTAKIHHALGTKKSVLGCLTSGKKMSWLYCPHVKTTLCLRFTVAKSRTIFSWLSTKFWSQIQKCKSRVSQLQ